MKTTMGWVRSGAGALLTAGLVLTHAACGGPDIQSYCESREACLGGNDADTQACVVSHEAYGDIADDIGCGSEFSDYYECAIGASTCDDTNTNQGCSVTADCNGGGDAGQRCVNGQCVFKNYVLKGDSCETESRQLNNCIDLDLD
jgi:hypothetical protein